jgi:hypothetical protein
MKKILVIGFLLLSLSVFSQHSFPKSWIGNYQGNLEIYTVDSIAMNIKMKLNIHALTKDTTYKWVITYFIKNEIDKREYELKVIDVKKGIYQIDEKNSILIDSYYKNEIFTSFFSVNDALIISTYSKNKDDTISFEIISANTKQKSISGGKKHNNEEIPEVTSYLINGRQKAILYKY